MTNFRSNHYPKSGNPLVVTQEYALRYYIIFSSVVVIGVLIKMYYGQPIFWFGIIGITLALVLGNFWASVQLNKRIAEVLIVGDSFSMISVHEIVNRKPNRSFPLRLANPSRTANEIHLHFGDQIMVLKKEDWEDFELIWSWFQNPTDVSYTIV
ncbi:MAG: hypothetical protein H6581_04170 [Bacteroidia bacterium]|nr:hypothetical protein [Bacteroidia bacterium]